jgi:hypothetical protein
VTEDKETDKEVTECDWETKETDKEVTECDWEGGYMWVLHKLQAHD